MNNTLDKIEINDTLLEIKKRLQQLDNCIYNEWNLIDDSDEEDSIGCKKYKNELKKNRSKILNLVKNSLNGNIGAIEKINNNFQLGKYAEVESMWILRFLVYNPEEKYLDNSYFYYIMALSLINVNALDMHNYIFMSKYKINKVINGEYLEYKKNKNIYTELRNKLSNEIGEEIENGTED